MSGGAETLDEDAMRYHFAHASDRGLVREQNEDAVAIAAEYGLALVADGMGGYNAGEIASGLAAEFLVTHLVADLTALKRRGRRKLSKPTKPSKRSQRKLHELLRDRIDGVNEAIIDAANRQPECYGMGTTLALLLIGEQAVTTLHLGDSRIYRMRDDVLSLLTRDHSLLQEQLDAGILSPEEARESISRNFITRALGVDAIADPEINEFDVAPGDLYLICSDGLPDMLSDEEIFDLLREDDDDESYDPFVEPTSDGRVAEPGRLEEVAGKLVEAANANGGRDNVSVVLASVGWGRARDVAASGEPRDHRKRRDRTNA
jgi:protein phosphatase